MTRCLKKPPGCLSTRKDGCKLMEITSLPFKSLVRVERGPRLSRKTGCWFWSMAGCMSSRYLLQRIMSQASAPHIFVLTLSSHSHWWFWIDRSLHCTLVSGTVSLTSQVKLLAVRSDFRTFCRGFFWSGKDTNRLSRPSNAWLFVFWLLPPL